MKFLEKNFNYLRSNLGLQAMAFLFLILPFVAAAQQDLPQKEDKWVEPDTAILTRDIPRILKMTCVPGISIAIIKKDSLYWSGSFGTLNDSSRSPINQHTVFEAASMSKPVFAYLVLRLVDRGEFDLDRPLFEMLQHPHVTDERYKRITARMVLTHSTGFPNWGGNPLALTFDPGTAFGYSGEGFFYLQKVIEKETGKSLQRLAETEVFHPLGMKYSSFIWQERFAGNAAYGKDWLWKVRPITQTQNANAAASLITTAADYGKFIVAVLNGSGLSPNIWKAFLTPARESEEGVFFGLGIGIEDGDTGRSFFHGGNNGKRFTSYMVGDLKNKVGLVFLTNFSDGITLGNELISRVFSDKLPSLNRRSIPRHDDRSRHASVLIQQAAVKKGESEAREKFLFTRGHGENHMNSKEALYLAEILDELGLSNLSFEVLQTVVEDDPTSASAHFAMGKALYAKGNYLNAIVSYHKSLALDPNNYKVSQAICWLQERLEIRTNPITVPISILKKYEGQYGVCFVALRNGSLYYKRKSNKESRLIPMTNELFTLEGSETLRIRFVRKGDGPAEKFIEINSDGRRDESERMPLDE